MRDQKFMTLGTHCSEEYCSQLDFLPFRCPSCSLPFCSDHWRPPSGHKCARYDPTKADNRIPSCPLCSTPISHPPTTAPDAAMDAHLSVTCAVLNPDAKARFTSLGGMPTCHAARCKTKLVVPFACAKCGESYCAPHRWETDHACTGAKASGSGGGRALGASGVGARASSGLAALRRAQASMLTATKTAASKANTPSGPSTAAGKRTAPSTAGSENATATTPPVGTKGNPLVIVDSDDDVQVVASKTSKTAAKAGGAKSLATATGGVLGTKTDKRAAAERASARKALEARAKKGLLTEKEKLTYATEVALEAERKNSKNGEGCLLS